MIGRWKHKKRGTQYDVIGQGCLQASRGSALDEEVVIIYRGDDGRLWVRPSTEFFDGRFEKIGSANKYVFNAAGASAYGNGR